MNILLCHPQKELLDMVSFCLESQMGLVVLKASNFQEAVDHFLSEGAVDLVVSTKQPETDKLFKYLLSISAQIPVILIAEDNAEKLDSFPDLDVIGSLHPDQVPGKILEIIHEKFGPLLQASVPEDYCRISTELLVRVVPLRGDIYIRLSSVKFVKLFRQGAKFTNEDLEKFLVKRKVTYLYMKKADSQEFVEKFKMDINHLIETAKPGDPELYRTISEFQGLLQELTDRLGFTPEVRELAKSTVQLTLKAIGNSPKLSKIVSDSKLVSKNYISSHSVMLANISCSVAAHMEWPSNTTFQKLALASLFHDFVIHDPELAKISTKKEMDAKKVAHALTDEQIAIIKSHPVNCAEIVKTFNEIPGDVDHIVFQHHERPDGSGYPKGVVAHHIAPLSAVFIVSHDMLDEIIALGEKFELKQFLKAHETEYGTGPFRKIWKALMLSLDSQPAPSGNGATKAA